METLGSIEAADPGIFTNERQRAQMPGSILPSTADRQLTFYRLDGSAEYTLSATGLYLVAIRVVAGLHEHRLASAYSNGSKWLFRPIPPTDEDRTAFNAKIEAFAVLSLYRPS